MIGRSRKKNISSQLDAITSAPMGRGLRNLSKQQQNMEELMPGLPDDLVLNCILTRVPWQQLTTLSSVNQNWCSVLQSRGVYNARVETNSTQQLLVSFHTLEGLKPVGMQIVSSPLLHADCALTGAGRGKGRGEGSGGRWNLPSNYLEIDRESKRTGYGRWNLPSTYLEIDRESKRTGYRLSLHDPSSNSWTLLPPIPSVECGVPLFSELACIQGKLFVLGGRDRMAWEARREVFMLDLVAGNGLWRERAPMITLRSNFGCGVMANKLYVAGGSTNTLGPLQSAEVYDPDLNVWESIADMTDSLSCCTCAVAVDEKNMYVIGGYVWADENDNAGGGGGGGAYNEQMEVDEDEEEVRKVTNCVQVFDVHKGEWNNLGRMKFLNDYDEQVCAVFDGDLYAFSTFGVERYEGSTHGWKQVYEDSLCVDLKYEVGWRMSSNGSARAPCSMVSVAPVGGEIFAMIRMVDECYRRCTCTLLRTKGFGKPGPKLYWEKVSCPVKLACIAPKLSALKV